MDKFFSEIQKPTSGKFPTGIESNEARESGQGQKKALPKGVVLGKDGKP